jgi:hypothetical protein
MAVQTFTPVELVAKTGRPMWSTRTKLTTPRSLTAMGSQRLPQGFRAIAVCRDFNHRKSTTLDDLPGNFSFPGGSRTPIAWMASTKVLLSLNKSWISACVE